MERSQRKTTIKQRYTLVDTIGSGTKSTTYLAFDELKGKSVCVKETPKNNIENQLEIDRLLNESAILSVLKHENVLEYVDSFETQSSFYLVTEYIKGKNLLSYVTSQGGLSEMESAEIMKQVLSGIDYIHKMGVAHRDIKAENVMIDTTRHVKIIDFGFATWNRSDLTDYCGSLHYVSPECLFKEPYDGAISDMWSVGVLFHSILANGLPWSPSEFELFHKRTDSFHYKPPMFASEECKDLLNKMICYSPADRITAEDALKHKFFECHTLSISNSMMRYPLSIMTEHKKRGESFHCKRMGLLANPLNKRRFSISPQILV